MENLSRAINNSLISELKIFNLNILTLESLGLAAIAIILLITLFLSYRTSITIPNYNKISNFSFYYLTLHILCLVSHSIYLIKKYSKIIKGQNTAFYIFMAETLHPSHLFCWFFISLTFLLMLINSYKILKMLKPPKTDLIKNVDDESRIKKYDFVCNKMSVIFVSGILSAVSSTILFILYLISAQSNISLESIQSGFPLFVISVILFYVSALLKYLCNFP